MKICKIKNCNNKHESLGYCLKHYQRYRKYGSPFITQVVYGLYKRCTIIGCRKKHHAKGLCKKHWQKQWERKRKKEIRQRKKQYNKGNKGKIAKYAKQWRESPGGKEKIVKYLRQWRKSSNGKASVRAGNHNRRLLESGLTKEIVQMIYEDNIKRYGTLTCILCGKPIEFGEDSLEHLTPLSKGGTNDYENLGIAHLKCNKQKNAMTLKEWNSNHHP